MVNAQTLIFMSSKITQPETCRLFPALILVWLGFDSIKIHAIAFIAL